MAINRIKTGGITDATIQSGDIAPGTIANDRLAGSVANAKLANSAITINGTSIALGASGEIVAGTDWQAVTVADGSTTLTAEAGKGYFLDTNTGVIEVVFPNSPTRGDTIVVMDYAGNFATNNAIINTQSQLIDSTTGQYFKLDTNNTVAEFTYIDSSSGWFAKLSQAAGSVDSALVGGQLGASPTFIEATGGTIATSGDFKIHTFTGDGNFIVSQIGSIATLGAGGPAIVDYLVVAGGGGGGGNDGGGGGAGGFRESLAACSPVHTPSGHTASPAKTTTGITVTTTTFPISVGAGGSAGNSSTDGGNGSNSVFSTITSTGGGGGAAEDSPSEPNGPPRKGNDGGSGGGAGNGGGGTGPGGAGNTPPVSPSQGNAGGSSAPVSFPTHPSSRAGGGGGGIDGTGGNPNGSGTAGNGADGFNTCITGSTVKYAAGGGGGGRSSGGTGGGSGVGGNGSNTSASATAGSANKGGGGGGAGEGSPNCRAAAGGKGVVIIKYKFQ